MITAIVFIRADVSRIPEVAEEIADLPAVSEVYSVTGAIDLDRHGPGRRARADSGSRRRPPEQGSGCGEHRDPHRLPGILCPRSGSSLLARQLRAAETPCGRIQKIAILATTATRQTSMMPSKPTI